MPGEAIIEHHVDDKEGEPNQTHVKEEEKPVKRSKKGKKDKTKEKRKEEEPKKEKSKDLTQDRSERRAERKKTRSRSRSKKKEKKEHDKSERSKRSFDSRDSGPVRAVARTGSDSSFIEYDKGDVGTSSGEHEQHELPEESQPEPMPPSVVTVHNMTNLVPDPHVVHPVVRFWVVDGATGVDISGYSYPYQNPLNHNFAETLEAHQSAAANGGFFTYPCNLRELKDFTPKWEDSVSIGVNLKTLTETYPEAVLLLEIIDCSRMNVQKQLKTRTHYGPSYERQFTPIAWGYLRLRGVVGKASNCVGKFRIQLFRSPLKRSLARKAFLRVWPSAMYPNTAVPIAASVVDLNDPRIPPIFYSYCETVNRLDKYPSSLHITLDTEDDRDMIPRHVSDGLRKLLEDCRKALNPAPLGVEEQNRDLAENIQAEDIKLDDPIEILDCARRRAEKCLQPDFLQASLPAGRKGCLALAFSPCGNYLALAACEEGSVEVRVHDTKFGPNAKEEGSPSDRMACPLVASFEGHSDTVYSLLWTAGSKQIITCSADCTAKQWPFIKNTDFSWAKYPTREELAKAIRNGSICARSGAEFTFVHPCYVYTAVHHPLGEMLITGGFDDTLRCWSTVSGSLMKSFKATPKSWVAHLALAVDGSMLFSADGHGELKLWTVSGFSRAEKSPKIDSWATIEDFKGKGVSCLAVDTPKKHLYVWTRVDSCVTCINTSTYSRFSQVKQYRGPRFESCAIKGSLSPCGSMVCTGSPTGTIFIWDTSANESQENVRYDYQQTGPVYNTVWSPTDHRMAFSSYSARLNLVTVWYRPRQEEDVSLVKSYDTSWFGAKMAATHRPSLPPQEHITDEPVDTSQDWMSQIITQWTNRVSKRCQRLIQAGTAVEVREGSFWRPANVSGWTAEGMCCIEFADGRAGTANVPPVLVRRLKGTGDATNISMELTSPARKSSGLTKATEEMLKKTGFLLERYGLEDTAVEDKELDEAGTTLTKSKRPSRAWGGTTPTIKEKKSKKSRSKSKKRESSEQ